MSGPVQEDPYGPHMGPYGPIAQAISILNSDDAFATFGTTDATSTGSTGGGLKFLQLRSVHKHMSGDVHVRNMLQKVLQTAAKETQSSRLSKVRLHTDYLLGGNSLCSGYAMPPTPCPRGGGWEGPLMRKSRQRHGSATGGRGRQLFGTWGHPLFSLFSSNQSPHTPADPKGSADITLKFIILSKNLNICPKIPKNIQKYVKI